MKKTAKIKLKTIPIEELHPYIINPNSQNSSTFANLLEEIASDGFEEPLIVVPRNVVEPGEPGYSVVSGNHRLKALQQLGYKEVDCVEHQDWDATTCKIKVVKRNQMRGETNPEIFSQLIDSIDEYTHDQLADAMAFDNIDQFAEVYQGSVPTGFGQSKDPTEDLITGMTELLNRIFSDYGHTVPFSYLVFLFASKIHLTVIASPKTKAILNQIIKECKKKAIDINEALSAVLQLGYMNLDWDDIKAIKAAHQDPGDDEFET